MQMRLSMRLFDDVLGPLYELLRSQDPAEDAQLLAALQALPLPRPDCIGAHEDCAECQRRDRVGCNSNDDSAPDCVGDSAAQSYRCTLPGAAGEMGRHDRRDGTVHPRRGTVARRRACRAVPAQAEARSQARHPPAGPMPVLRRLRAPSTVRVPHWQRWTDPYVLRVCSVFQCRDTAGVE